MPVSSEDFFFQRPVCAEAHLCFQKGIHHHVNCHDFANLWKDKWLRLWIAMDAKPAPLHAPPSFARFKWLSRWPKGTYQRLLANMSGSPC